VACSRYSYCDDSGGKPECKSPPCNPAEDPPYCDENNRITCDNGVWGVNFCDERRGQMCDPARGCATTCDPTTFRNTCLYDQSGAFLCNGGQINFVPCAPGASCANGFCEMRLPPGAQCDPYASPVMICDTRNSMGYCSSSGVWIRILCDIREWCVLDSLGRPRCANTEPVWHLPAE